MPTDILIDGNNNIVKRNGDFVMIEGADFIKQSAFIRTRIFRGEFFLDNTAGIDTRGTIHADNPNIATFNSQYKNVLLNTFGVIEILEYTADRVKNESLTDIREQLTVTFRLDTVAGTIEGSESFNI
jgi:hypothetical protein